MCENDASRIVLADSRVSLQIVVTFPDNSRGISYDHNMFIVHETDVAKTTVSINMSVQSKLLEQNCMKKSLKIIR